MNINVNNEDRELLRLFFKNISNESKNSQLLFMDSIEELRIILEKFIYENNLNENLVFNLFLNEVRHDEIIYKLKKNKNIIVNDLLEYNSSSRIFPVSNTIKKWYEESMLDFITDEELPNKNDGKLVRKLNQNNIEMQNYYVSMVNEIMK